MNLSLVLLPILILLASIFVFLKPAPAYKLYLLILELYAKIVKRVPLLNDMAETSLKMNKEVTLQLFREASVFIMLTGGILLAIEILEYLQFKEL